jgi:hypothetical protein
MKRITIELHDGRIDIDWGGVSYVEALGLIRYAEQVLRVKRVNRINEVIAEPQPKTPRRKKEPK